MERDQVLLSSRDGFKRERKVDHEENCVYSCELILLTFLLTEVVGLKPVFSKA